MRRVVAIPRAGDGVGRIMGGLVDLIMEMRDFVAWVLSSIDNKRVVENYKYIGVFTGPHHSHRYRSLPPHPHHHSYLSEQSFSIYSEHDQNKNTTNRQKGTTYFERGPESSSVIFLVSNSVNWSTVIRLVSQYSETISRSSTNSSSVNTVSHGLLSSLRTVAANFLMEVRTTPETFCSQKS